MSKTPGPSLVEPGRRVQLLLATFLIVAALYFAREVFIPQALAILLTFALAPLVNRLLRMHSGAVPSVICVVLLAFLAIAGIAALIGTQLTQLTGQLSEALSFGTGYWPNGGRDRD